MKSLKKVLIIIITLILIFVGFIVINIFLMPMHTRYDITNEEYPYWHINQNFTLQIEEGEVKRKVVVAIVDTGTDTVDFPYPNILEGKNILNQNNITTDRHGHGKVISHLVASPTLGINKYADILPVKVRKMMRDNPKHVSMGIRWAVDHGADIINLSIGREKTKYNKHEGYFDGVDYALKKGVLLIASSGTTGNSVYYPAAIDGVISVGGIDKNHKYHSNIDPEKIDIFAVDTKEKVSSSFPTAIVSGAVSLVMTLDDSISAHKAMEIILETADVENIDGKEVKILNVDRAIQFIRKKEK
ncbi:Subtilase family protein [Anaerovirgula multivorans]|uniref:Subtilase family protein n=1 Tax=Anaerovirgula multivorans TaxID=312168 RepID=A0A239KHL7_9FIRM|nr:S8/S53 family peptidase [Anaerovirgula multivorans]SNT17857.1 Subtilase family protein [Anaerovirgula multivorans]